MAPKKDSKKKLKTLKAKGTSGRGRGRGKGKAGDPVDAPEVVPGVVKEDGAVGGDAEDGQAKQVPVVSESGGFKVVGGDIADAEAIVVVHKSSGK